MNKNIVRFIALVMILTAVSPIVSEGVGYVKEIDGGFYGLHMEVDGKKVVSNKEPFIYEDEVWVPLSDLAKGLGLGFNLDKDKKTAHLSSKEKLKVDGDNSKEISSFQKGFQVEAKERMVKSLEDEIYALEKDTRKEKPELNKGVVKNIKVYFGDVAVYLDKKKLSFNNEPMFYKDDIYVSIIDIANFLYITPTLDTKYSRIDVDANGILVKKDYYEKIDQLIGFRDGRNYLLGIEIENLEKRKELFQRLNIPYRNISSIKVLENHLNKYMGKIGDLAVTIEVKKSVGNWLDLTFSFPYSKTSGWYKLQRKDVEDYIWDVYSAILTLYNEDALVEGRFKNSYYSKYSSSSYRDYVKFSSKGKDLSFDFSKSYLKKDYRIDSTYLADTLNKNLNKYNKLEFKYAVEQSGDSMDLDIRVNSKDFFNWYIYNKTGYLKRLNYEIRRINPDLSVDGTIFYDDDYDKTIEFNIEDSRVRSVDLLRETEDYLNSRYGSFSYGRYDFGLKYSLYEKGIDDLDLIVEGGFSVGDDSWTYAGDSGVERLNNRVQGAISYIMNLWDMSVFTEVVDKNMIEIDEIDVYKTYVGLVHATPQEGTVKEGTKVYLYTDNSDATIYYTLDGSMPNTGSMVFRDYIIINRDVEINAFGYKEGLGTGPVSSFRYEVEE